MKKRHYFLVLALWLLVMGVLFLKGVLVRGAHPFDRWSRELPGLSSFASPGLADLTGDGVLDVVLGAGQGRFVASDTAVLALDGRDGRILWTQSARAELFGRPTFLGINADSVPDVLLHGRRAQLMALDGRDGSVLWRYQTQDTVVNPVGYARFNFYQPQVLDDQDGDAVLDLLLANGGNDIAPPDSRSYRYPGVLLVISGATGRVIAADTVPDGRETYLAPLLLPGRDSSGPVLLFGTGGEDLGGALYRTVLSDLLREDLSGARQLAEAQHAGFLGHLDTADLNADGHPEVLAVAHHGLALALDGRTEDLLWRRRLPDTRVYDQWTTGRFSEDGTPDLFITGTRPAATGMAPARQWMLDGKTGETLFRDSLGCPGMSRPVALPSGDGEPQRVLLSVNSYDCARPDFTDALHYLYLLDPRARTGRELYPPASLKNIASTPWAGDLDHNGRMDLVFAQQPHGPDYYDTPGLVIQRIETDLPWPESPRAGD